MKFKHKIYPEARIFGFSRKDGSLLFYNFINSVINDDSVVLDVGCGRGLSDFGHQNYISDKMKFKGRVRKVIGIDIDESCLLNPKIDEFKLIDSSIWPLDNNSVDILIADYVLEHVKDPDLFFSELNRVLKTNGYFFLRTTNSNGYVAFFNKCLPSKYHANILLSTQKTREAQDIFQTFYKVNTKSKLNFILKKYSLDGVIYSYESEPSYFKFSFMLYKVMASIHNLIPSYFRNTFIICGKK
jgi:ubiquinone/menaquinone biosynthesis C-methylase UbiE